VLTLFPVLQSIHYGLGDKRKLGQWALNATYTGDDINTRQVQLDSKMESITDEIDSLSMHTAEIDITQKREVQKFDITLY
jgi:hypothetical protein